MGFGEHPDDASLILRQGKSPVEALSFAVAVQTGAVNDCGSLPEAGIHLFGVHQTGLKRHCRLSDILEIFITEMVKFTGLHVGKRRFRRQGVIAPVPAYLLSIHKNSVAVVSAHPETEGSVLRSFVNAFPADAEAVIRQFLARG